MKLFFDCFSLNIAVQKTKPIYEADNMTVFSFRHSNWFSIGNPVVMQADPFLFSYGGTLYIFYEEMHFLDKYGVIKMVSTKDLMTFTQPVQITNEPDCHFSYPMVFEDNGEIYMMPETGGDYNIRLYKATSPDMTKFELFKVILERREEERGSVTFDLADSCLHKKDDKYYLFTSYYMNNQYYLELYLSDNICGPYDKHPMSPICTGNKYGRCGGSLIEADGHLYRPAQDCTVTYGGQIHLLEIDELSATSYREHSFKDDVLPKTQSKYKKGGHHLNYADFKGRTVVATDSKYYCTFLLEHFLCRILSILGISSY